MSTIVYQSFQSRYDDTTTTTHVSEPWSLSLKLTPPNPQPLPPQRIEPSQKPHHAYNNNNRGGGGWSCIESLSTASPNNFQIRKEYSDLPVYVHPLVKRASSKLSDKSLEMCTENLGCETGTDMNTPTNGSSFSSFFFSSPPPAHVPKTINYDELTSITTPPPPPPPSSSCQRIRVVRSILEEAEVARKKKLRSSSSSPPCREFPPPLTSMSGSSSILVRPRREMGRLVMTAVSNSPRKSNIVAERSDGRLRMSLLVDDVAEKVEDVEAEEVVGACWGIGDGERRSSTIDELMESAVTMASGDEDEDEDGEEEEIEIDRRRDSEEEEEEEDNSGGVREEEEEKVEEGDQEGGEDGNVRLEGDIRESGRKMEVMVVRRMAASSAATTMTAATATTTGDQFHRPSRCKESGRGGTNIRPSTRRLINWETFWVATSS